MKSKMCIGLKPNRRLLSFTVLCVLADYFGSAYLAHRMACSSPQTIQVTGKLPWRTPAPHVLHLLPLRSRWGTLVQAFLFFDVKSYFLALILFFSIKKRFRAKKTLQKDSALKTETFT